MQPTQRANLIVRDIHHVAAVRPAERVQDFNLDHVTLPGF